MCASAGLFRVRLGTVVQDEGAYSAQGRTGKSHRSQPVFYADDGALVKGYDAQALGCDDSHATEEEGEEEQEEQRLDESEECFNNA